jgi:hypothetical protein
MVKTQTIYHHDERFASDCRALCGATTTLFNTADADHPATCPQCREIASQRAKKANETRKLVKEIREALKREKK